MLIKWIKNIISIIKNAIFKENIDENEEEQVNRPKIYQIEPNQATAFRIRNGVLQLEDPEQKLIILSDNRGASEMTDFIISEKAYMCLKDMLLEAEEMHCRGIREKFFKVPLVQVPWDEIDRKRSKFNSTGSVVFRLVLKHGFPAEIFQTAEGRMYVTEKFKNMMVKNELTGFIYTER